MEPNNQQTDAGLKSGNLQDELQRAKDDAAKVRNLKTVAERREERESRKHGDIVRASINSPHSVKCDGKNIAITIRTEGGSGSFGTTTAEESNFPFRILNASTESDIKVSGYSDSYVFSGTDLTAQLTLGGTGLDTATAVSVGDVCYLKFALDSDVLITASEFNIGAKWSGYPDMFHVDTGGIYFVDEIYLLIAEIVAASDTRDGTIITVGASSVKVVQRWRNNVRLHGSSTNGIICYLPTPYA